MKAPPNKRGLARLHLRQRSRQQAPPAGAGAAPSDDRQWFSAHPQRHYRLRRYRAGDRGFGAAEAAERATRWIVVVRIEGGRAQFSFTTDTASFCEALAEDDEPGEADSFLGFLLAKLEANQLVSFAALLDEWREQYEREQAGMDAADLQSTLEKQKASPP